ncbi:MAG: YfcE family phosphodiesterase [Bacillota bacterium]|nr:YfcE family phosphodiesterase [Bacillota bacterium]
MKVCVFSDSHGYAGNMIAAIGIEKPDICFHLGDGERDLERVREEYPGIPIYAVKGNCDICSMLSSKLMSNVGGVNIFATHGHLYNVKHEKNLDTLAFIAAEAGADIALYGHTHMQNDSHNKGVHLLNPGSCGYGGYAGYAVIEIDNGKWHADLRAI